MRVAIIPARGGSKRIPRKNIRPFCGKPIIAYSIEAARMSGCFDRIIVSTDDDEIADVAVAAGAEVPFRRPLELSHDHAGTIPVIAHAIEWLRDIGDAPELVCCLYATAPFARPEDIRAGLQSMLETHADYALAVTSFPFPIQRAVRINSRGEVEMIHPENFHSRSQDLEETFHDAGQFCWGQASAWLAAKPVFMAKTIAIILPRRRVQDIDTQEDWEHAEWMFRAQQ